MKQDAKIVFPMPKDNYYFYKVPKQFLSSLEIGKRVYVPLRNRKTIGYIVSIERAPDNILLKEIIDILDEKPLFDDKRLRFYNWISKYYFCSLGLILKAAHPGGLGINLNKTLKITEKGIFKINTSIKDDIEKRVLQALAASETLTLGKIINLVEGASNSTVNGLISKKLIESEYLVEKKTNIKTEKIISLSKKSKDKDIIKILSRKRPVKGKIIEYLSLNDDSPYSILKQLFGNISAHIKWLSENAYIVIDNREIIRDPFSQLEIKKTSPHKLNPDQQLAFNQIKHAISSSIFKPFLLHGVTGSGKTEVYLYSIVEVIKEGGNALVLVPEISLTPQLVTRFKSRFGKNIAVLHSGLSEGERYDSWRQIYEGKVNIAIGARSSIFAPFKDISIIIVDEEHESTYKQEENPTYNARDLALVLGKIYGAVVILGSATPSVESFANSIKEKFHYLNLPLRAENQSLPRFDIIDMKKEKNPIFSVKLHSAIIDNFESSNQTILFLNRRGFSSILICRACGETLMCPNCSIALTYHLTNKSIKCHYCGLNESRFDNCLKCGTILYEFGFGTQKIEEEVKKIVPKANVARMDRDELRNKNKLLDLYNKLENKEVDILIGTQMVAKGHDLPGVTLVGIISADMSLYNPDFRAGERTFQLITQVAGRSGRGLIEGKVIVQTFNPDHSVIKYASRQDSTQFLNREINLREKLGFPPFSKLINLKFTGTKDHETSKAACSARDLASRIIKNYPLGKINILGPSPAPVYKIKNKFRWHLILNSVDQKILHNFAHKLISLYNKSYANFNVKVSVDVDPLTFS